MLAALAVLALPPAFAGGEEDHSVMGFGAVCTPPNNPPATLPDSLTGAMDEIQQELGAPPSPPVNTPARAANPAAPQVSPELQAKIDRYSADTRVDEAIRIAHHESRFKRPNRSNWNITGPKSPSKALGKCYRYVKIFLMKSGLVSRRPDGVSAAASGTELKRLGFRNLLEVPEYKSQLRNINQTPKGAILVYSGGAYGHIEMKTGEPGQGGFISDYYDANGRTNGPLRGDNRRLIGVYIK